VDEFTRDIEDAQVAHWSCFGRWPRGALIEEAGTLRFETPIPNLPYNGVIRTHLADENADQVIASVVDSFARRGVAFAWWDQPSSTPADIGRRLEAHGLAAVMQVVGMSLELDGWSAEPLSSGVRYEQVLDDDALLVYEDLLFGNWELPEESEESRALIAEGNRFLGPGRVPMHRWIAYTDEEPAGKGLLCLAGPPGVAAVYGMWVRPQARGRGIGFGITTALIRQAQELGCHRVVLHASDLGNPVYRRAGFVERCSFTVHATARVWSSTDHRLASKGAASFA
jgi:GNAT superfamily N-acetyltransferase